MANWRQLYTAAMLETDRVGLALVIDEAECAMDFVCVNRGETTKSVGKSRTRRPLLLC
jgi:hypothetical protein